MYYDFNGNLETLTEAGQTTNYTWDARDRLTNISGPGLTASFAYDAKTRRTQKTITGFTSTFQWTQKTITGFTSTFQYDGADIVREVAGGSGVNYLRGLGIDEHLARIEDGGNTTCYAPDALGSTLAFTNSSGSVATEYTYEPFGRTTVTGASSQNAFQLTGRENDGTGLYYYRARYLSTALHRFVSPDPLCAAPPAPAPVRAYYTTLISLNTFAYASNSPFVWRDPLGLSPECAYYERRCAEVRWLSLSLGLNKLYYCVAAKRVCEGTSRDRINNCIRECLQDHDRNACVSTFGRKDRTGLTTLCAAFSHANCFAECIPANYEQVAP
jgi:RHS repeat-associated protein